MPHTPDDRLQQISRHLSPKDGRAAFLAFTLDNLPSYDQLPPYNSSLAGCAWQVWGDGDQLGTVNLLTPEIVKRAANEEMRTGRSVSLNWPLSLPSKPMFNRKVPEITYKPKPIGTAVWDDEIWINTQSGTQWDGLRHFGIFETRVFYQNTPNQVFSNGLVPTKVETLDPALLRIGIHNWANHGICGRGVLLDLVEFYSSQAKATTAGSGTGDLKALPYDPWKTHAISLDVLLSCAKHFEVQFRQGDILIIRAGFIKKYAESTQQARDDLGSKPETFAGIEQSEDMKRFLWDNHFAAIASDQPALERWPVPEGTPHLHQTLLGLWGMPIGEMFDLEELSKVCKASGRYSFFFTSWPLNIIGGSASPPNAAAYF